jgi:hypothetical protein
VSLDLGGLSPEELAEIIEQAKRELAHRQLVAAVDQEIAAVVQRGRDAGVAQVPEEGQEWQPVHHLREAYLAGDVVSEGGEVYRAEVDGCLSQPSQMPEHWTCLGTDLPTEPDPEPDPELGEPPVSAVIPWEPDLTLHVGETTTYEGVTYRVRLSHETSTDRLPPDTPSLYAREE